MVKFNPDKDIPELTGKVIIVTGGNIGLGRATIAALAKHSPQTIYLAARTRSKAETTISEINATLPSTSHNIIKFLELDLTSFDSIKAAAKTVTTESTRLDLLINNAGIMACPDGLTKEGYEVQFGTNHVGHALLTKSLLPLMRRTAKLEDSPEGSVRVVNVSSGGEALAPKPEGIKFADLKKADGGGINEWTRYGQSKLANILHARALAVRHPEIVCVSIHPGVVATNLILGPLARYGGWLSWVWWLVGWLCTTPETGAWNQTWAAVAPVARGVGEEGVRTGEFYHPVGVTGRGKPLSEDLGLAERLWEWTERELEGHGIE